MPNNRNDQCHQRGRADPMLNFDLSVVIQRPAAAVFALLADIQDQELSRSTRA